MSDTAAIVVAALVTAGVTLCLGILQLARMREQNRIALFERRLACFRLAQGALSRVFQEGKADGEALAKMLDAVQTSWFIFPRPLSDRLEKTYNQMVDTLGRSKPSQEDITLQYGALSEVLGELTKLRDLFEPFMHVTEPKHPLSWVDESLDWLEGK
ncbi:MAG: hypothetical protein ABL864_07535 [Terricaulis sp.]